MKLAVFFPGIGYNCDRPLLYYAKKLAQKYGYETLPVVYRDLPLDAKSSREKTAQCTRLAMEQAERVLEETGLSRYSEILFVGKSIGTILAAKLAGECASPEKVRQVLYTPLMETFGSEILDGVVFTGGNDPWTNGKDSRIAAVCEEKGIPCFVIPDANHSLETGDPVKDTENLVRVMRETERFIRRERQAMELLDICDENGFPTGKTVDRETAHREGVLHRTAHIWVIREKDGKTEILLQKRSMGKDSFPGMFDTSSAGHVPAGEEPLCSALRELGEELGIRAQESDLQYAGKFRIRFEKVFHGKVFRENEVARVFVYDRPVDAASLTLQASEVDEVRWFGLEEVEEEIQTSRARFCVPQEGLKVLRRYLGQRQAERDFNAVSMFPAQNDTVRR